MADALQNVDEKTSSQEAVLTSVEQYGVGEHRYPGSGTQKDPYIVDWDQDDPENPYNWTKRRKWLITIQVGYVRISNIESSS